MKCNCGFESEYFSNHMGEYDFETGEEYEKQDQLERDAYYDNDIFLFVRIARVLVHDVKRKEGGYSFSEKELYMCPKCNTVIVRVKE